MRNFTLYNFNSTSSFSLSQNSVFAAEPTGLGTKLDIVKSDGSNRYYVSDMYFDFEPITFKIYFGAGSNAYTQYNSLMSFISNNGKNKFILAYTNNNKTLYCDVWLKEAPKKDKNEFNVLVETFVFERLSYWFTNISIDFTLTAQSSSSISFPLDIPIPFPGIITSNEQEVINDFLDDYLTDITIVGPLDTSLEIYLKDANGNKIQRIIIHKELLANGNLKDIFYINGDTKKVTYYNYLTTQNENGYSYIDHTYDSFLLIPNGTYRLGVSLEEGSSCIINITYRKWVLD